jgi:hypothetical protein
MVYMCLNFEVHYKEDLLLISLFWVSPLFLHGLNTIIRALEIRPGLIDEC